MNISMIGAAFVLLAAAIGALLGAVFYGGLYWTVSRGLASKHPALWFLLSLLVRVAIVLLGFYFVLSLSIPGSVPSLRLISCLVAFTVAGLTIRWCTRPSKLVTVSQLSEKIEQSLLSGSSSLAETSSLSESSFEGPSTEALHAPHS